MLLCFDIGNTNVVVGAFADLNKEDLSFQFRLSTDSRRTLDEYQALLMSLLQHSGVSVTDIKQVIIASVVPPLTQLFFDLALKCFNTTALLVGPGIKTGLAINVHEPAAVGADRVVNALALKTLYGYPGVIIDFGTATSIDYLGNDGSYEGGIIAPGLNGALDSLVRSTAKLPRIEIKWPKSVIGKNTITAMQSGSLVGYVCLVDGLVEKIMAEFGELKHVVATGGLGQLCMRHSKTISKYDPDLNLQGLRLIAGMNLETS